MGGSEGELVGVSRRVVGARVGLWMNTVNGVCVYEKQTCLCDHGVCETVDKGSLSSGWRTSMWAYVNCQLVEWWVCQCLSSVSLDTDAVTEVCVPGLIRKCDHTCGGRKDMGLGRMLSCSVLEARTELSPQGGLGAGGWAQWSQRRGAGSRRCPQHSLHTVDICGL